MRPINWVIALVLLLCTATFVQADPITFEDRSDGESVTNQYPGVLFSNATAVRAGISLNEFSFPPHSGAAVVFDDGGSMSLTFLNPVSEFGAYFTYTTQLTLVAYDSSNNPIATMMSSFSNNTADGGDPGSAANEFILFTMSGISRITITGLPTGGSFVMDDATFTAAPTAVPEPATLVLMALGLPAIARWRKRKNCK
jgi:hypothetical protein